MLNEINWEWDVWKNISEFSVTERNPIRSMVYSRIKNVDDSLSKEEICHRIKFCIKQLPEEEAEAIRLLHITNFKMSVVAKEMKTTVNQMGNYWLQAKWHLRSIKACNIYEFGINSGCEKNEQLKSDIITKIARKEYNFDDEEKAFLAVKSSRLELSTKRALNRAHIESFNEIIGKSFEEIMALKWIGNNHAKKICEYLKTEYNIAG